MKVLKCLIVNHTKKEDLSDEVRFYVTKEDEVAKGDIFAVWAHGRLAYAKVQKVFAKYEYLKAENNGTALEDIPQAMNRIDFRSYNIFKAMAAKTKRLTACLQERLEDGKKNRSLADALKELKGEAKADAQALLDAIKSLEENPEAALED